ncbi:MAG: NAD(P)-dependent oxidoreductase [Acidimicrobiaceae bacterium]|nr:NAD(P)-binding domain-containing protein [Acidimicrobiaceae bacterium]MCY3642022.1 NAD(P)-binding domain-containing protein [Acidimicrobiaceae bacterium]MXY10600.1 NAD(P)-dependent oxidoreductase [Acidimicrobiaceae bacterium]MXZ64783.1 NAD(P)-dependent oxidoreductase [Acidimicrobiaceae bacterium]MYE55821.1 NAD(P)-dependent oxidoreductase [Acidimicrobiaceae bacterium]
MTGYGYIGLGMMGSAMAENLIRHGSGPVTVHDLDPAAVEAAVAHGAAAAADAAEVARVSDVVSVCVPAAAHIEAVLSGPGGIVEGSHERLCVLIHSTVHPATVLAARAAATEWGVTVFDASVAGGAGNAREGNLTVLAGGLADMPPAARELLEVYAGTLIDAGPVGAGAALKIAINVMTYAQFAAAATAHDMVTSTGGEPAALLEAWRSMGQLGALTEQYCALLGIPDEHIRGELRTMLETQAGIATKDLSLALEVGRTRPGASTLLDAVRRAMPAVYNVHEDNEESQ